MYQFSTIMTLVVESEELLKSDTQLRMKNTISWQQVYDAELLQVEVSWQLDAIMAMNYYSES